MPECKHEEISRLLADEITRKLYTDRFPPVRELAARFEVSTRTMTKALKPLIKQGLIIPEGPRGCRVATHKIKRSKTNLVGIFAGIGKIVPAEDPLLAPLLDLVKSDNCTPLLTDVPQTDMIRDNEFWRSSYLDGYIFVYSSFNLQLANLLKSEGIPFVAANRLPENYEAPWADFDHYPALCELYQNLRNSGSCRIALLDKPSFSNSNTYISTVWQRVQEYYQVPHSERCGTFGTPELDKDYQQTLMLQLGNMSMNGMLPDTVVVRNVYAGKQLRELIELKKLPIKLIMAVSANYRPPYGKLAEAVWNLFKQVRDNRADFSSYIQIPYSVNELEP